MMKKQIIASVIAVAFSFFTSVAVLGATYEGTFTKITSTSNFTTGYYVVAASESASSNAGYALGNTVDANKRMTGISVTITNGTTITNPSDAIVWYITVSETTITMKNVGDQKYLYQTGTTSGKGMGLNDNSINLTLAGYNAVSPIGFKITLNGASNNYFKYNASSKWFANYANDYTTSMTPVRLFKLTPSGYTVTYNANGATSGMVPTDATAYSSGTLVTVLDNTGSLAKTGCTFGGWNTQADGLGTNRAAGSTFSITANTTLYAKWNAKSITGLSFIGTPTKTEYLSGESFDPAGLTVTATYNDSSSENVTASVTWDPDPLTTGTTSVTGTYMGETINVTGLTVTAPHGSTPEDPFTVAEARAKIDASGTTPNQYARGIISQVDSYNSTYKSITYWISDDGTTTNQLEVYGGLKSANNESGTFTEKSNLQVGDIVIVCGTLKKYSSTYEFDSNNFLSSVILVAPTYYPLAGAVASGTELTISDLHTDATIYYTDDGTEPTPSSTAYDPLSKPTISSATTFKAIAVKDGYTTSSITTAAYTILEAVETPTFSLAEGTYTSAQSVTISCATDGATIYYTTDGSNPTISSTVYSSAISVDETMTIKAIAAKDGMANSAVAEATYTMNIPAITAADVNLIYLATSGSIAYSITRPASGALTAEITAGNEGSWLALGDVSASAVAMTCSVNEGVSNRTATVTLTYTYESVKTVTKVVTITQSAFSADYAELPFEFDSGKSYIESTAGLSQSGLGSDYSSKPKLKFDNTGDYLVLKIESAPGSLSFKIKNNSFSGGTFKVQTSSDGVNYSDLATYTSITETQSESFDDLDASIRYIKWVYTEKSNGNVGLGSISVTKAPAAATINITATLNSGRYWATFYNAETRYTLPAGAQAFTMDATNKLYLLGSNGSVIPAGKAVVIIADKASITLTKSDDATAITDNAGTNILRGSNSTVAKSSLGSLKPYVLGVVTGELGFYEFTGDNIPANKAFFVK